MPEIEFTKERIADLRKLLAVHAAFPKDLSDALDTIEKLQSSLSAQQDVIDAGRVGVAQLKAENEKLRKALRKLYDPAKIAVNQIICLGGDDLCQPCQNREELALALEIAREALKEGE
jgi:hypothetical protein